MDFGLSDVGLHYRSVVLPRGRWATNRHQIVKIISESTKLGGFLVEPRGRQLNLDVDDVSQREMARAVLEGRGNAVSRGGSIMEIVQTRQNELAGLSSLAPD